MLDLAFVALKDQWVVGLSLALAAWSWSYWWAYGTRASYRGARQCAPTVVPFCAGMLLIAASLAWGASRGWERACGTW